MIAIVCVDKNMGIRFNKRRVSSDSAIIQDMIKLANKHEMGIRISIYSKGIFARVLGNETLEICNDMYFSYTTNSEVKQEVCPIYYGDDFAETQEECMCFFEEDIPEEVRDNISTVIVYDFGRRYPSDVKLTMDLTAYTLQSEEMFAGSSHPEITRRIYTK